MSEALAPSTIMESVVDELMSGFDLKWQHLTLAQLPTQTVVGAWSEIKRAVVAALGPSGFSLLARAREQLGKTSLDFTAQEISELLIALELGANPEQRRALEPVLELYRPSL